jgi:hypothetical protein
MSQEQADSSQSNSPQAIEVTFTATLRYEPWEVESFDITEQAAIENLASHIAREPGNAGEFSIERNGGPGSNPTGGASSQHKHD